MKGKYEVNQVAEVAIGGSTIKGRIDWVGWDGDKYHYLIEWVGRDGDVHSRWFDEGQLETVSPL